MKKDRNILIMDQALKQAKIALSKKEVPVGAVIVDSSGVILSKGYNKIESSGCQTGHAEVITIERACKKLGTWRLDDCSIYVTLEPCLMCLGLIQLSRIKALYFGAVSKDFGSGLSKAKGHKLYRKGLKIVGGLKETESADILKQFFIEIRKKERFRLNGKGLL